MSSWNAKYIITIGSRDQKEPDMRERDIDIDDPTDREISSSPFFNGDREKTRRNLVKRKADKKIARLCNHIAVKTELPTTYESKGFTEIREDGLRNYILFLESGEYRIGFPISETDLLSLEREISIHVDDQLDSYSDIYNMYLKSNDVFNQYKLLYLIADPEAYKDIELRVIRNMLHHTELNCIDHPDQCRKADELFGPGVKSIDYSNPDHQKVVRDNLPKLRKIAKSIMEV